MLFPAMLARTTIPAALRAPYRAGRWIGELRMPLAPSRADAVELLVAELVTASVKHAMADGLHAINVSLHAQDGVVRVEVVGGGGGPPAPRPLPVVPDQPDEATGFGFYLVDKVADRWGFSEGP